MRAFSSTPPDSAGASGVSLLGLGGGYLRLVTEIYTKTGWGVVRYREMLPKQKVGLRKYISKQDQGCTMSTP